MGEYSDYTSGSGKPVSGVCHARGVNADLPAKWLVYVVVADLESSLAECRRLGGAVVTGPKAMDRTHATPSSAIPPERSSRCTNRRHRVSPRKAERRRPCEPHSCCSVSFWRAPRPHDAPVQRVIVVQTDDVEGYLKELENARATARRLQGTGVIRAWRARFAGSMPARSLFESHSIRA